MFLCGKCLSDVSSNQWFQSNPLLCSLSIIERRVWNDFNGINKCHDQIFYHLHHCLFNVTSYILHVDKSIQPMNPKCICMLALSFVWRYDKLLAVKRNKNKNGSKKKTKLLFLNWHKMQRSLQWKRMKRKTFQIYFIINNSVTPIYKHFMFLCAHG